MGGLLPRKNILRWSTFWNSSHITEPSEFRDFEDFDLNFQPNILDSHWVDELLAKSIQGRSTFWQNQKRFSDFRDFEDFGINFEANII